MVNAAGNFIVTIPAANAGDRYQVTINAQNSGHQKASASVTTTVPTPSKPGNGGTTPSTPHQPTPDTHQPTNTGNQNFPQTGNQSNTPLMILGAVLLAISSLAGWRVRKIKA